uniref:Uncharacterized protein n=1 Tax=Arundo donax TaxID=35708 RepID=A0A0A9D0F1_ARUDO
MMASSTSTWNRTSCPPTLIWVRQNTRTMWMMMNPSWTLTVLTRAIHLR